MDRRIVHHTYTTLRTEYLGQSIQVQDFPSENLAIEDFFEAVLLNEREVQREEPFQVGWTHFFLRVNTFLESKLAEKMHNWKVHFTLNSTT